MAEGVVAAVHEVHEFAVDAFSAVGLAKGAALGQRQALIERYGEDLDANSHGESFLKLFQARFVPGGLYLLDEPEAPLSPQSLSKHRIFRKT